jgi:choline monooxygenase
MSPVLTQPLASDVEVARRVLAHIDAGTTDEGEHWREPVRHYLDPARFADEVALLRTLPSVFIPSAAITAGGDHLARAVFDVPLFGVRDRQGRARVFRNACRHRGVALVDGSGCSRALVCPYHGWTYRLDGSLAHVPHADSFPDLDVAERGLVEVPSEEVDGLVLIGGVTPGASSDLGALSAGHPWRDVFAPELQVLDVASTERPMNWKVLVEQFLEGYHIRTTHRETFFPLQYDDLNVVETFGRNARVTYPFRNIERLRDRPESEWTVAHRLTFVYHLFPNVMVATFPEQISVIIVDPIDIGHSRLTTFTLGSGQPRSAAADGRLRGRPLIAEASLEDDAMSRAVQVGLGTGANEYLEFGRHESAIGHFHRNLTDLLDKAD